MSGAENSDCRYQEVGKLCEGMRRVSILKLRQKDLAYYSDASEMAGVWGSLNQDGKEIVAPKYIYAYDFSGGIAIVARGKWTIDPKWDNAYAKGKYWRESERWGGIDRKGREVRLSAFLMKSGSFLQKAYMRRITAAGQPAAGVSLTSEGNGLPHRCLRISALIIMTACLPSLRRINAAACAGRFADGHL